MPAIAPDISRRSIILACCAACARGADPAQEAWDSIAAMAAALGNANAGEFLAAFDPAMPAYETLRANVTALVAQVDVQSGIDPLSNEGDARAREVAVDWLMRLVDRTGLNRVTNRHDTVKCRMEKRGRRWKVVSLDPVGFFAPPSA
jgi:hypothetical protein